MYDCVYVLQLSRYCDTLLRKNAKIVFDAELDDKLSMCVTIFKYLDDKDVFQKVLYATCICVHMHTCFALHL